MKAFRVAALALAVAGSACAQDGLAARLSRAIPDRMEADGVAGAVVVLIEEGRPVWSRAFGWADPAAGRAMTQDALFRVESISKPLTAWGAMRLAEAGRLDLDAPITACLHGWAPPGAGSITARQLLSQTAGIGLGDFAARHAPGESMPDLELHLAEDFERIAPPGSGFAYSDTGFNLLELVMEGCAGEDFAAFMAREVLEPLGMAHSGFDWTGAEMPVGHDLRGRPVTPYVYPGRASGGLHATAGDVARFAAAGMAGAEQEVLSTEGVAALHRPEVAVDGLFGFAAEGYALGHFTETLSDGRAAVWHGGQGYGWMSHVHLVPGSGDGIVILSNGQRAWPLFAAILREWSASLGVQPVGMARVLWAERVARVVIGLLLALAAVALLVARRGRARGMARVSGAVFGLPLLIWPLWAVSQDYLFLFSILPGLWAWLAAASVVAGLALGVAALRSGGGQGAGRGNRISRTSAMKKGK